MQDIRNCKSKTNKNFVINIYDEIFDRCPISQIDAESVEIINIVNMSGGEFGMNLSPSALLEETAFFFNVKSIISRVYNEIERFKKEKRQENG
mgnify:FL=1